MKKKRKISIPAAKFGIGENSIVANFKNGDTNAAIGGMTEALPDAIGLLAAPFQKSTASTGKEATMQSVAAIGQGAATGFKVAGPVGAAVGAAVGMIGSGGEKANMTSFTDYDEGTLGTGLIGAFGNRGLRRERARIKQNAYSNRDAVRGTEYLQSEALEDMLGMNTDTFAVGGQTSSLAYVDDGELMRTPDGQISKVPERGKPTDSNLVNMPDGTRILSNTLKVPGTKYTFAQMADKMIKKKKSRGNDMYAQNAAKLNQMNDEQMYNQLFELQEQVKAKKGIKPKTKQLANAYLPGGETGYTGKQKNLGDRIVDAIYNPNRKWGAGVQWGTGNNQWYHVPLTSQASDNVVTPAPTRIGTSAIARTTQPQSSTQLQSSIQPQTTKLESPVGFTVPLHQHGPITNEERDDLFRREEIFQRNQKAKQRAERQARRKEMWNNIGENLGDIVGSLSALPGIISDLSAKPEHFDAVYNPYAGAVRNTMARRRYDINPELEDITRNRAVSNYNASQFNTGTGANMAYRLQSAVNTDRAISSLRAKANNANNQYLGEYANILNDLGRQWVASTNLAVDQNARSRAAARNIQRQGYAEIGKLGQQWAKDYNQRMRDREMLPLYDRFLSAGFTDEDLELLRKNLRSYRTRKG